MTTSPKLGYFLASSAGQQQFPYGGGPAVDAARQQILKDCVSTLVTTLLNTGATTGFAATPTTPYDQYDGLDVMDKRAYAIGASLRPGGKVGFVLHTAPPWMTGKTTPGYADLDGYPPLDKYVSARSPGNTSGHGYAEWCVWMLARYTAPPFNLPIDWAAVWSEYKGLWSRPKNAWDSARYNAMFNAVAGAIRGDSNPLVSAIKLAGPYATTRGELDTGIAGHPNDPKALAYDGSSVRYSSGAINAHVNVAVLNAVLDFARDCVVDIPMFDAYYAQSWAINPMMAPAQPWPVGTPGTRVHRDGRVIMDDIQRIQRICEWFVKVFGKAPTIIESYPGDDGDPMDFLKYVTAAGAGGARDVVLWGGVNAPTGPGSALWKGTTRTPVGDIAAAITSVVG